MRLLLLIALAASCSPEPWCPEERDCVLIDRTSCWCRNPELYREDGEPVHGTDDPNEWPGWTK